VSDELMFVTEGVSTECMHQHKVRRLDGMGEEGWLITAWSKLTRRRDQYDARKGILELVQAFICH